MEEQTLEGMRVERTERGRYHCQSQSEKETTYIVDLMENAPLGGCTCRDFQHRRLPKYEREGRVALNKYRCKHLQRVRNHVMDQILMHYQNEGK